MKWLCIFQLQHKFRLNRCDVRNHAPSAIRVVAAEIGFCAGLPNLSVYPFARDSILSLCGDGANVPWLFELFGSWVRVRISCTGSLPHCPIVCCCVVADVDMLPTVL